MPSKNDISMCPPLNKTNDVAKETTGFPGSK